MITHDFFFSYRKSDANLVRNLANWCRASGVSVWLDEDSIPITGAKGGPTSSEQWEEFVQKGIEGARHILLFTNERWVNSKACRKEGTLAVATEKDATSRILRICLGGCEIVEKEFPALRRLPRLVYSDENSFADFVLQHCKIRLRYEHSPRVLANAIREGMVCRGRYLSISVGLYRSSWEAALRKTPQRQLTVQQIEVGSKPTPFELKLSYGPYFKYIGFDGGLLPQTSDGSRIDEELQAAYRRTAITFLAKNRLSTWLGTHQVWRDQLCHFSMTYLIPPDHRFGRPGCWMLERLFSVPWQQHGEDVKGELHFTFQKVFSRPPEPREQAVFQLEVDAVFQSLRFDGKAVLDTLHRRLMGWFMATLGISVGVLIFRGFTGQADNRFLWSLAGWTAVHLALYRSTPEFRQAPITDAFLKSPAVAVLLPTLIPFLIASAAVYGNVPWLNAWWTVFLLSAFVAWIRLSVKAAMSLAGPA